MQVCLPNSVNSAQDILDLPQEEEEEVERVIYCRFGVGKRSVCLLLLRERELDTILPRLACMPAALKMSLSFFAV